MLILLEFHFVVSNSQKEALISHVGCDPQQHEKVENNYLSVWSLSAG